MTTALCLSIPQHSTLRYIYCSLSGHSLIHPHMSKVFFFSTERVCLPRRQLQFKDQCTFRMIITSQWIFVTPCSLSDGWSIVSERWQMFSELTPTQPPPPPHPSKKIVLLSQSPVYEYDLLSKGTAGVTFFFSFKCLFWSAGTEGTPLSADRREEEGEKLNVGFESHTDIDLI